jgi:pyrimidine-nucleoside phosphorylase
MLPSAIIAKKRDCEELTADEIRFFMSGFVDGSIPEYQMSALAMAMLCRGMNESETADLTDCMLASGIRLSPASERPRVDKHSTGGLGDKTSLILAPLLACFDLDVPMLSGRGLGITGGTLDKLEAIEGYRCDLTESEINSQLRSIGCVITGTTPQIAPADRKLYALRDVTATVPSVALITASIMSKKLAESLDALVLDVKYGSGAFMQALGDAEKLAESLVRTGQRMQVKTSAILSDMNQPLGRMVGNACEVNEAIEVLKGIGPADVRTLTLELCAPLLISAGKAATHAEAIQRLAHMLDSGTALDRFQKMVESQSGKFAERLRLVPGTGWLSPSGGRLLRMNGQLIGQAVIELGGGRRRLRDPVDPTVGLEMLVRLGDPVEPGQPLVRIFARDSASLHTAQHLLENALRIEPF